MNIIFAIIIAISVLTGCSQIDPTTPTKKILTEADLRAEIDLLKTIDPQTANAADYPQALGIYAKNNLPLTIKYYCSDVCPDAAGVFIVYSGINTPAECAEVGGYDRIDPAWGGYEGCAPLQD